MFVRDLTIVDLIIQVTLKEVQLAHGNKTLIALPASYSQCLQTQSEPSKNRFHEINDAH